MTFTPISDAEAARRDLELRREEAGTVLGRLPDYLRLAKPPELLERVHDGRFAAVARTWELAHGNLLLLGHTEAGKSSAAAYVFRRHLGRGVTEGGESWRRARRQQWFGATDLERARLEHRLGQGEAPEIQAAMLAPLVVLDELGWDRDVKPVSEVIARRYELRLPTIATSGMDRRRLVEHYGAAVVRKLLECGGPHATIVEAF